MTNTCFSSSSLFNRSLINSPPPRFPRPFSPTTTHQLLPIFCNNYHPNPLLLSGRLRIPYSGSGSVASDPNVDSFAPKNQTSSSSSSAIDFLTLCRSLKVEMILQALEYETEHGKVLDEFFLSTAGKFQTDIGKSWAAEIISRRKPRLENKL